MHTVIINGSHRSNGYTQKALSMLLAAAPKEEKISVFHPAQMDIHICTACNSCEKHPEKCVFEDDMQRVYEEVESCDNLVIVTPVYFSSAPAALKTLLDRFQMFYNRGRKSPGPKRFYLLALGGSRPYKGQFEGLSVSFIHLRADISAELASEEFISGTDGFEEDFPDNIRKRIEGFGKKVFMGEQQL